MLSKVSNIKMNYKKNKILKHVFIYDPNIRLSIDLNVKIIQY